MAKPILLMMGGAMLLSACNLPPKIYSPDEILDICEQKRDEADGVTGGVNLGVNSETGPFLKMKIGINDKIDDNLDPDLVYENCIQAYQTHNEAARKDIAARRAAR